MLSPRYKAYLKYLFNHKKGVYIRGRRLGLGRIRLLLHDWDKFLPGMLIAYAETFYDENGKSQYVKHPKFDYWWLRHQQLNKHHYQHEILHNDDGTVVALDMEEIDIWEMLADWEGVAYAKGKENPAAATQEWYHNSKKDKLMSLKTRYLIEKFIKYSYFEEMHGR